MSKRLRASMRAANKGRNLRPRASVIPGIPQDGAGRTSSSPPEESFADLRDEHDERDDADADDGAERVTVSLGKAAEVAAASAAPSVPDVRAREAVREPSVAPAPRSEPAPEPALSSVTQPSAPGIGAAKSAAKEASTAVQVPSPAESFKPQPVSAGLGPAPVAVPAPVAAKEDRPLATALRTETPKPAARAEAAAQPVKAVTMGEPPKPPAQPAPASEPVKAAAAAPKKVEEPRKAPAAVEASKKAAPVKVEEPKKAAPVKVEEPRKAAPAKAEEPRKAAPAKAEDPKSRRPAALRAVPAFDDELSSISAEFFRKDEDSVPPAEEHEEAESAVPIVVLSPAALARRALLRKWVAGVVAFASVITVAVVSKQVLASKRPMAPVAVTELKHETPPPAPVKEEAKPVAEPQKVAATEPAKADVEPKAAEPAAEAAKKDDDKKPDEAAKKDDDKKPDEVAKKDDDKKPDEAAKKDDDKPPVSAADAAALKKETLSLLNRGKTKDAIAKARESIAADPTDATSYLYLGSALQDSGKWKDGIEAYCECVRNSTKGPVNECRAMGGHK